MATLTDWNAYMNLLHELALVEDDLRTADADHTTYDAHVLANNILFERFGVDTPLATP